MSNNVSNTQSSSLSSASVSVGGDGTSEFLLKNDFFKTSSFSRWTFPSHHLVIDVELQMLKFKN